MAQSGPPQTYWLQLKEEWQQAAQMVAFKQSEIDRSIKRFLAGKGPLPSFEAQQELREMRSFELSKRADLDEYIFQN